MNTIQNMIATFHRTYENGSILCEHTETSKGVSVTATALSDSRPISVMSHFVSFDEVTNLDIVNRKAVRDALILAGIADEGVANSDTDKKPAKVSKKKAVPASDTEAVSEVNEIAEDIACVTDEAPTAEEVAPDADEAPAAEEIADAEESASVESVEAHAKEDDPAEEKVMTVEEARAVILAAKSDAKTTKKLESSSLKEYIGKPIGEFADNMPSQVYVLAARAGKESSMLTPETEQAMKIVAGMK